MNTQAHTITVDERFYELSDHLWRAGRYGYYWLANDGEGAKLTWWESLPTNEPMSKRLIDKDCYWGVHPSRMRRSQYERASITDIEAINCLYFEIDCADSDEKLRVLALLDTWHFTPACVVDSGGGLHVYILLRVPYVLDCPEKLQHAIDLQYAIVELAGGDNGAKDLARVLRVPGTVNWKDKYAPNFPTVTIIRWDMSQQYDLTDVEQVLQPYISARATTQAHTRGQTSTQSVSLSDQELLDRLFRLARNGATYERLWNGDLSVKGGDQSSCDVLLCDGLAFVTNRNKPRMDRLFRQSGLMRPKWDEARSSGTYGSQTIDKAADSATQGYDPQYSTFDDDIAAELAAETQRKATIARLAPLGGSQSDTVVSGQQPARSPFLSFSELMLLPAKQWLIHSIVGKGDIVMVYGEPGSGKTMTLIDMIMAACQGKKWANRFDVARPLSVAYCAGEGVSGLKDRFASALDHWGVTTLPNFYFLPIAPQLFGKGRADHITEQVKAFKTYHGDDLDILVIDTLHAATAGADENSAKDMGTVLDAVRAATRELGCAVILCHHTAKDGEDYRGSSALHGAMDTMIKVKKNGSHTIECKKLKDGEPWKPQKFDMITKGASVYVLWDGQAESPADARHSDDRQKVIDLLFIGRGNSYTIKDIHEGINTSYSQENTRTIIKNLETEKIVVRIDYGQNKRPRWGYQINDAWAAIQGIAISLPR